MRVYFYALSSLTLLGEEPIFNIGLLLGEPSGGLTDVDLDSPEALALAHLLPTTGWVSGRSSNPYSHYWFITAPRSTVKYQDPTDGAMLLELRGTGGQTVVPGSIHPSGEPYVWHHHTEPARVNRHELQAAVSYVAGLALLARHWPKQGRQDTALALAGGLLRVEWPAVKVREAIQAICDAAHDEATSKRLDVVGYTEKALADGKEVTGWPRASEVLGDKVVAKVREWLSCGDGKHLKSLNSTPYLTEGGRICRQKFTKDGPVAEPLCNFTASVREEMIQDDGVETARAFLIGGTLDTGLSLPPAKVPAHRFAGMTWVTDAWGLKAVVRAGTTTRDYLREAIQRLSPDAPQRRIFTHTGWREIDGQWRYLHGDGAVGADGVEVSLASLSRYRLPQTPQDPKGAMQASLRLLRVAPFSATVPLWAAVHRAVLGGALPVDLSVWLEGQTGNFKSTVAALFLSHFGDFTRLTLPGAWSATGNALEKQAFTLKDALFVIDDYAPNALDSRELEAKAARLLRGQGNLAGRARLRADLSERPGYPPRGIILATGEQHPPGQSLLARTLLLELNKDDIALPTLTTCQAEAQRLPHALAGFILWLVPQMPALPTTLKAAWEEARRRATTGRGHMRVPEILAHLWLGIDCPLAYAVEIGSCSHAEAADLRAEAWAALMEAGRNQAAVVEEERPFLRFLRSLTTLVTQRKVTILPKHLGEAPEQHETPVIGWEDEESLYLLPDAVFTAVARFCRESGEPFPLRQVRLAKDLHREKLTTCDPDRSTAVVKICGRARRVWHVNRKKMAALLGESTEVTEVTGSEE